jgi:[ribosomal protein S18]-alanine N-acetyltransferase
MAAEPVELEFARSADASTLALMSRDLVETGLGWSYQPHRIAELIHDPDAVTLVSRDGARAVGFAIMRFGDERAHLVLMAVRPTYRRRGIARRMLSWLIESAATAGSASVHVELRADNAPAYAMYEAMGFAETLRVPHYYRGRETAVRMLRVLRAPGWVPPVWRPPAADPR